MPKISVELKVNVTLEVPKDWAGLVQKHDAIEMATNAIGGTNGVQIICDVVAQEDCHGNPVFADCYHEVDQDENGITDIDDGFVRIQT